MRRMLDHGLRRAKCHIMLERRINGSHPATRATKWSLVLPEGKPPKSGFPLLVLLHGQGESGARLEALLPDLATAPFARLFIDAPWPVELRHEDPPRIGGAWYAYVRDDDDFRADIFERVNWLENLVDDVISEASIDRRCVGLFGYSQGGYLASVAAVSSPSLYRGLCAVSTRVKVEMFDPSHLTLKNYPILVIHGRNDPSVSCDRQLGAVEVLKHWGAEVTCEIHDGGHGLRRTTGALAAEFFTRVFATCSSAPRA